MAQYLGNSLEQGARSKEEIRSFLADAPVHATLFLRAALDRYDETENWWFGVRPAEGGALEALSCKQGVFTAMYATSNAASTALGDNLARVSRGSRDGAEHHVMGPKKVVDRFFQAFKVVDREMVHDHERALMGATARCETLKSARIKAAIAAAADEPVLFEFLADQSLEQFGRDPRRMGKESHRKFCQALTAAGRAVVGRQGVAPFMAAELVPMGDSVLIERLFFPRPFRRTKLMGRGLAAVLALALDTAPEALIFADSNRAYLREVADLVGFEERETYRLLVLR